MNYAENLRKLFIVFTILTVGTICIIKVGAINLHALVSTSLKLIPALIVMGYLGYKIGTIIDNPKNRDDADYKLAVLNALKKMDGSISLQDLNEKLRTTVAEPDVPDSEVEAEIE